MMTIIFQKMEAYASNSSIDLESIKRTLTSGDLEARHSNTKRTALHDQFGISPQVRSSFLNSEESPRPSIDESEEMKETERNPFTQSHIQSPQGDKEDLSDGRASREVTTSVSPSDEFLVMLTQNLVDDTCIRQERIQIVRKRLQRELNIQESDEEEVSETFSSQLEHEISKIPNRSVPETQADQKRN